MHLEPIHCEREVHGKGAAGVLYFSRMPDGASQLRSKYAGQVQTVYIDPPFNTGKRFDMRQRIGDEGFRTGKPNMRILAYDDKWEEATYLDMMRQTLTLAHDLLREDGTIFLHIDSRMHAQLRLILDDIFGRNNFLNEIIWAYQTGGRALGHFSRKHDIILFYRKSKKYYFNIRQVPISRSENRQNHMRCAVDEDGRRYRSIRSGGKEYRYYDDDPTYPGDVWDDVSHLQQKDPQRSGYDTQKPLKLLERIIRCSTRPGDLVCDLFFGSGTTLVASALDGRRFLGVDASYLAHATARKRLDGHDFEMNAPCTMGGAQIKAHAYMTVGFVSITLECFTLEHLPKDIALGPLDAIDQWSAGFLRDGVFYPEAGEVRSKLTPQLSGTLEIPLLSGEACLETIDIWGQRRFFRMNRQED